MIGSSRTGLLERLLESDRRGDLERHLRRIDVVLGAVEERTFTSTIG